MTDIFQMLHDDHTEVNQLIKQIEEAGEPNDDLMQQIADMLMIHTNVEDEVVYSVLEEADNGLAEEARTDHEEIDNIVQELVDLSPEDDGWMKSFGELAASVRAHVKLEEDRIFTMLKQHLDAEEQASLATEYAEAKQQEIAKLAEGEEP